MTIRLPQALSVAAAFLCACGGGNGTISGKVTFADGSDAAGLPVTLLGAVGKRVDTGAGGAFSFDKLPDGVYLVSVEAADTLEHRLSFGTQVTGREAIAVPDLVFNAQSSLKGKVNTAAGQPASGATVYLSGSDRVAVTDGAGSYGFFDVPAGDYSLLARAGGSLAQQASAMVKLKRGKNDAPALTLGMDVSANGKLEGSVFLYNQESPKNVKVSVADVSAMTDEQGAFSLSLPPGEHRVTAELAGYPKQSLGRFVVRSGETTVVPSTPLSIYTTVPVFQHVYSSNWAQVSEGDIAVLTVQVDADYTYETYAVDTRTFSRRLLYLGSPTSPTLSRLGKWFAFQPTAGAAVTAINTQNGQAWSFSGTSILGPVISSDESTLMFFSQGQNQLVRVDLATGVATSFPAFAPSFFQTNDRFLARSSAVVPFDVQLITPTTAATVFNQMQAVSSVPTTPPLAYAYTCAIACDVKILSPSSATVVTVTPAVASAPTAITGSVKDWLGLAFGANRVLVKVADGSTTPLPATIDRMFFNESQARVVTYTFNGAATEVREDVVPPSATSPVLMTSLGAPIGNWISPTRFMVFGGSPSRRVDIKNGVATTDMDVAIDAVTLQSPLFAPPGVLWLKQSTLKRLGSAYDSADFPVDTVGSGSVGTFTGVGSRSAVINGVMGKYAALQ
jgi:hypothetical protein